MPFCSNCGTQLSGDEAFCSNCGTPLARGQQYAAPTPAAAPQQVFYAASEDKPEKSRIVAFVLALLLGGIGIHKFYLGQNINGFPLGVAYILLCWTFVPAIIALVEAIIYITKTDQQFYEIYVVEKKPMF